MEKRKGFSLLEVMFALSIACILFCAMTSQFVSTKKLQLGTTAYLNKVYLAETIVKLLKDQIHINPYFYLNINNTYIPDKSLKGYIFDDEEFKDPLASKDYIFEAKDIPIVMKGKKGDNATYYFGFFKSDGVANSVADASLANNIFLNVKNLEKYTYDLKIKNEETTTLNGILKEVTVTVRNI
ncbi:MAG TPA: prepilin-type N-terminal cleavage/methylation domain-containing protein, partial [Candidatus Wallbacteria bacterium]|nr:prepilin-type N-terminal cleavage/methylation domain-containing protein [Candidatus Wallbacteria bacterium]